MYWFSFSSQVILLSNIIFLILFSGVSPEIIKSFNGVLSRGFDSESLAISIKEAIAKKYDRDEIRQYILENYNYEKIAQQYIQLYNRILQSK